MQNTNSLLKRLNYIKSIVNSNDVIFENLTLFKNKKAVLIYLDALSNKTSIGELIIKPLLKLNEPITLKSVRKNIYSPALKEMTNLLEVIDDLMNGNTILIIDGITKIFSAEIKSIEKRSIQEPPTATVLKGPREGFVENLQTNICLIRRRIKTPNLKCEYLTKGKFSNTQISLVFIEGIVQEGLKEKIIEKLNMYDLDAIIDSSYVAKLITENKGSLFKQIGTTEKPDVLCAKILEGRIGILVDGSPLALTLPYLLIEDFQGAQDYYTSVYHANTSRFLRATAIFMGVMLPAFYVAAQIFHLQLIPLSFLLTIVNSIKGIPLSPSLEMFVTLIIFEILNQASVRMPRYVGMVVSIVGGLVLGETAVNAGIISAPALMIIAFSAICLYTVPDLEQAFSLIRIMFLLIAGVLGGYGLILASNFLMIFLTSKEFLGTPLLAPISPLITKDLKDSVYKNLLIDTANRPKILKSKNKTRLIKKG